MDFGMPKSFPLRMAVLSLVAASAAGVVIAEPLRPRDNSKNLTER